MREQIEEITCDGCGKKLKKAYIDTSSVAYEGSSTIDRGKHTYTVGEQDYCSFECLVRDIAKNLGETYTTVRKYRVTNVNTGKSYEYDDFTAAKEYIFNSRKERGESAEFEMVAVLDI